MSAGESSISHQLFDEFGGTGCQPKEMPARVCFRHRRKEIRHFVCKIPPTDRTAVDHYSAIVRKAQFLSFCLPCLFVKSETIQVGTTRNYLMIHLAITQPFPPFNNRPNSFR